MRWYDNTLGGYQELRTSSPNYYIGVHEMEVIWEAYGLQIDLLIKAILNAFHANFIYSADLSSLRRLGTFLLVAYDSFTNIEDLRAIISSCFIGKGHIGKREIEQIIRQFTTGDIEISFSGGIVSISIARSIDDAFNYPACLLVLRNRIPAHLGIGITQMMEADILTDVYASAHPKSFKEYNIGSGASSSPVESVSLSVLPSASNFKEYNLEV